LKRENIFFNQAALNLDHFPGAPGVNTAGGSFSEKWLVS